MAIYELPFSKGLCDGAGDNRMPYAYSTDLRNIRIINQVSTVRKGYKTIGMLESVTTPIRGLASNNSTLYAIVDSKLKSVNTTTGVFTNIGTLPNDNDNNVITFGKYTIILTGAQPYVYDGTTLSAVTTYVASSNPSFGTVFLNFSWVAGTGAFSNTLYISRPVSAANPIYAYDWSGIGADQVIMKSSILGMVATLSKLVVFTENSIEWFDRSSYTTIGGVLTFYPNPLANGEGLVNSRSVVSAGDIIFFLTADKKIKTIDYVQGIDDLRVGELSDDEKVGIPNFMNSLNDDLTDSVGFYDQKNKLIKFFVRSKTSLTNDTCIIWDLVNKTFLVDDNKFYCVLVNHDNKVYAGSCLNPTVYQDEFGQDDDGGEISWYRYSGILANGRATSNKMLNGVCTTGAVNSTTGIRKDVIIDGDIVDSSSIQGKENIIGGIASSSTGSIPTGGESNEQVLQNFVKNRGPEYINIIGRYLQIKYSGSGKGQNFTLETIETKEKLTSYEELTDK